MADVFSSLLLFSMNVKGKTKTLFFQKRKKENKDGRQKKNGGWWENDLISIFSLNTQILFFLFFFFVFSSADRPIITSGGWNDGGGGWFLGYVCVCVFQCLKGPETAVVDFSCRNVLMFLYFSFFFALLLCRRPVCLLILFSLLFQSGGWTIASRSSDSLILRQQCLFCVTLAGRRVCYSTTVKVFVNKLSLVLQARELSLGIGRWRGWWQRSNHLGSYYHGAYVSFYWPIASSRQQQFNI